MSTREQQGVVTLTGDRAPTRSAPPARRRRRAWILPTYTGVVLVYLFIPIAVMILFGFNDYSGRFNFVWQGFTLKWYRNLLEFPDLTIAIRNTLIVATVSTIAATVFGTLIALALTRYRWRGRGAMNLLIFVPMTTPEIVMGAMLLSLFVSMNLQRGFLTIIIAHIMFLISFVVVTVKARTSTLDRSLEDAAQDLGATPWTTFWTVTFPLILPGVVAGAALAFVLSVDDFVVTVFNAGPVTTLTLWVYGASRLGIPAQVNVMGTLIFLFGVVYVTVSLLRSRREA